MPICSLEHPHRNTTRASVLNYDTQPYKRPGLRTSLCVCVDMQRANAMDSIDEEENSSDGGLGLEEGEVLGSVEDSNKTDGTADKEYCKLLDRVSCLESENATLRLEIDKLIAASDDNDDQDTVGIDDVSHMSLPRAYVEEIVTSFALLASTVGETQLRICKRHVACLDATSVGPGTVYDTMLRNDDTDIINKDTSRSRNTSMSRHSTPFMQRGSGEHSVLA